MTLIHSSNMTIVDGKSNCYRITETITMTFLFSKQAKEDQANFSRCY